jgi:hypothetical protein
MSNTFEIRPQKYPVISTNPSASNRKVLHSWKEISNYTGRGVRTVQRYEQQCGLPVRRASGNPRSAVLAFSDELDTWFQSAPMRPEAPAGPAASVKSVVNAEEFKKLLVNRERLRGQAAKLVARINEVRKQTETLAERIARRRVPEGKAPETQLFLVA